MINKIKVLAFCPHYLPGYKAGGPIKTVKNLLEFVGGEVSFRLLVGDRDLGDTTPYASVKIGFWNKVDNSEVFYVQRGLKACQQLTKVVFNKEYDIIYLNSFFSILFSLYPLLLSKLVRRQVVLGPRGEFSRGAIQLKPYRKILFIALYKMLRLHRGVIFQASSEYEAQDIRRVIGEMTDVYVAEDIGSQVFARDVCARAQHNLKIVFISRISPKKNLLAALEMLMTVKESVIYSIYGPIEDKDYWAKCLDVIKALPKNIKVEYKGELKPEDVVQAISVYDLFFMPTKGENYGHVIAEALCAGLPLLIADTTPWRNLQAQGLGWDISLSNPRSFSKVIDTLAKTPIDQHFEMRRNVLSWAKEKFTKRAAIDANIYMFRYALSKGDNHAI